MKSELDWIRTARRLCKASADLKCGIGDDAAVLKWTPKKDLLVTTDMILEDRHFKLKEASAYQIGWKAMAVNLSDIAAMGGLPTNAVVSLGVPPRTPSAFLRQIYRGLLAVAGRFGVRIVGGDTNAFGPWAICVTLLGQVERGKALLRSGAKIGDWIFVSGSLGGSYRSGKHLCFMPRIREARYLARRFSVHAMMDLSDGLASDIRRIAEESRVGAVMEERLIPRSSRAVSLQSALSDGEDFELLFTLSPSDGKKLVRERRHKGLASFTKIGEVTPEKSGIRIRRLNGKTEKLRSKGYDHFQTAPGVKNKR
jgi:thiamine-monophosphate kinase